MCIKKNVVASVPSEGDYMFAEITLSQWKELKKHLSKNLAEIANIVCEAGEKQMNERGFVHFSLNERQEAMVNELSKCVHKYTLAKMEKPILRAISEVFPKYDAEKP